MKKFLAFFLIAVVACEAVDDLDLESIQDWIVDKVTSIWNTLTDAVKKAINWLKDKGIYDLIKDKVIQLGKVAATTFCSAYLSPAVCGPAVEGICTLIGV